MKLFMRGLTVLLLCVSTLGVLGCETSNETEAERLAKTAGDAGKPDAKGVPETQQSQPKSQEEFGRRSRQKTGEMFKQQGGSAPATKK